MGGMNGKERKLAERDKKAVLWWKDGKVDRRLEFTCVTKARVEKAKLHQQGVRRVNIQTVITKKLVSASV